MSRPVELAVDVIAAGGVLWRPGPDGTVQVGLVHRPRYDDWTLPKGKLDRGESPPEAAVRELAEESGFRTRLGPRLGEVHYSVPEGRKRVHYWSARAEAGEFAPNPEVDELRWLDEDAANTLLSYQRDREVLDRFHTLGQPPPTPLLLVRHAQAGKRREWTDDDLRPLTDKGREQAHQLAGLLRLFGPTRVYSAPPVRCVDTVRPLADSLGVPVVPEPLLGEVGYWRDPVRGLALLPALADQSEVVVACSQGGVIPEVVRQLTGEPERPARKASTWVLGFAGDRVVSDDYYPAPALPAR